MATPLYPPTTAAGAPAAPAALTPPAPGYPLAGGHALGAQATPPAPGDLVAWRRTLTKGKRTTEEAGFAVVCEVGRGYASLWPLTGPVTRRLQVALEGLAVLIPAGELVAELDRRHSTGGAR